MRFSHNQTTFYAFIVAFGGMVFGLDLALISGTGSFIQSEFGIDSFQLGVVTAAPGVGVLLALLAISYFCDRIGRKYTLIAISVIYLISAIGSAFSSSYEALVFFRFFGGLGFASLSLASMYIGEIAPARSRGRLVGINQMNAVIGIAVAYFINYLILQITVDKTVLFSLLGTDFSNWRIMLGVEILPACAWLLLLFIIPESPRWHISMGRQKEAVEVLIKLTDSKDEAVEQFEKIAQSVTPAGHRLKLRNQFVELFESKMQMALLVGIVVAIVQPITGANAVIAYAPLIFEQVGGGENAAFAQSMWIGLVNVVFTLLALLTLDKFGRRPILLGGLIWASVSMGVCAYGFGTATYQLTDQSISHITVKEDVYALGSVVGITYESDVDFKNALEAALGAQKAGEYNAELIKAAANLPSMLILVGIMSYIAAYAYSIGIVLWIILSEIFPTHLRSVAIPLCAFVASIGGMLVPLMFPWQLSHLGASLTFWLYAIFGLTGFALLLAFLPETKNKTIEEIEADFLYR